MSSYRMNAVSLHKHVDRILREMDQRYEQRFKAQESAAALALASTKEALQVALNTVKETGTAATEANKLLAAKAQEFADQKLETHNNIKPWVTSQIDSLIARIEAAEKNETARVETVERRVSRFENREEGMTLTTKLIMGAAAFLATLLTIYFSLHK